MIRSIQVGTVAAKVLDLVSKEGGPVSMEEVNEQLVEPIGLMHLGISQLVAQGRIEVFSTYFGNYLKLSSLQYVPEKEQKAEIAFA